MIAIPAANFESRLAQLGRCCGISVAVVALVVLSGWIFDLPLLQRLAFAPGPMSASAAIGFLLLGVAAATAQPAVGTARRQWVARTAALLATGLGVAAMIAVASGGGLELFPIELPFFHRGGTPPGALPIAPATALCFTLMGVALLLPPTRAGTVGLQVLAVSTGLVALATLLGYAYGVEAVYRRGYSAAMSLPAAANFLLLAFASLSGRPQASLVVLFMNRGVAGTVARGMLPMTLALPAVMGLIPILGIRFEWYGARFGVLLCTIADVAVFSAVVWVVGMQLNRMESLRAKAEEKFRLAVESAPSAMIMVDRSGQMVMVNSTTETMFGYSRGELLGQPIELLVPDRVRGRHVADRDAYFQNPVTRPMGVGRDLAGRRKDGSELPVEVALNAVDAQGTLVLAAVVDITRRKQAEDAVRSVHAELEERVRDRTTDLQAANQELEAFSYSVSHDLRAPLRAIDGFSRILLAEFSQSIPPEAREYLQDVRRNTQKMGQLVDDLLAFSRLGRQPVKLQQVSVDKLVAQCVRELATINERPVEVTVAQLPDCQADPALLKQVWINLLSNAMKYSARRESPQIEVGCRAGDQPGRWTYFVKDNGVGFDMRYADKLFGVFQRLHRAEDYDGTGVGLAIVKRVVTRHGGAVWADAELGRGATFYFTLTMGAADDGGQRSGDTAGRGQSERSEVGLACVSHA